MKKILINKVTIFLCAIFCLLSLFNYSPALNNYCGIVVAQSPEKIFYKILEFFAPTFDKRDKNMDNISSGNSEEKNLERQFVYAGGIPIGFSLSSSGVVIVELSSIETPDGIKTPTQTSNISVGDILVEIDGEKVVNGQSVIDIVNKIAKEKTMLNIKLVRKSAFIETTIEPVYDMLTNSFRLGLWVRDNAVGVGTLTFVDENNNFGALGHPITDIDTGAIIPVNNGMVYKCSILGVTKGQRGIPGELKGLFLKSQNEIGLINENNYWGVYGSLNQNIAENYKKDKYLLAYDNEIKIGSAKILTTIDGSNSEYYDIEIIKNNYVNSENNECMIIKIVDEDLLNKTGGIVQGMSGSPIIQDNKIVGCVTHVFINDPTKGFANYISKMYKF